jgi:hypothetical protein
LHEVEQPLPFLGLLSVLRHELLHLPGVRLQRRADLDLFFGLLGFVGVLLGFCWVLLGFWFCLLCLERRKGKKLQTNTLCQEEICLPQQGGEGRSITQSRVFAVLLLFCQGGNWFSHTATRC